MSLSETQKAFVSAIGQQPSVAVTHEDDAATTRERRLKALRYAAIAIWATVVVYRMATDGFAFDRELLLLYISTGLIAAGIGQGRRILDVVRDWLPFAVALAAYDLTRGAATLVGRPTLWQWAPDVDRWLFFGKVPTVWLQEHIKLPRPPWWEVVIGTVYMSYFILPYVIAAVLWLRNRDEWKDFVWLFLGVHFAGMAIYVLVPAAPPWAAARCTADDVAGGPPDPKCMFHSAQGVPDGGLLGAMQTSQDGAHAWVERISFRGWDELHLHSAGALINKGQASVNMVAAIPSLHAGLSAAIAVFLWFRVQRRWRPLLAAYQLIMAFTLVYSAEHYVIDLLLGWVLAAVVLGTGTVCRKLWSRPHAGVLLSAATSCLASFRAAVPAALGGQSLGMAAPTVASPRRAGLASKPGESLRVGDPYLGQPHTRTAGHPQQTKTAAESGFQDTRP